LEDSGDDERTYLLAGSLAIQDEAIRPAHAGGREYASEERRVAGEE